MDYVFKSNKKIVLKTNIKAAHDHEPKPPASRDGLESSTDSGSSLLTLTRREAQLLRAPPDLTIAALFFIYRKQEI